MTNEKILVIGSNSFSGSHFVAEALDKGHCVWGLSRSDQPSSVFLPYNWGDNNNNRKSNTSNNFKFVKADLNKDSQKITDLIERIEPELIVNFAAQGMVAESWLNPTHWYSTNIVSQVALHDYLRSKKFLKKYVHVTTPEVYGNTGQGWISENTNFKPSTPYAVSRAACDLHLMSFFKAYGFPVVFTRAANVYGPGQQLYRIIPRSMLSARSGSMMDLHGGGLSKRAFIHIKDVVSGTLKLAYDGEPGTTWHLSTQESISIRELVEKIFSCAKADFNTCVRLAEDRLGKDQNYLLDSSAMREQHKWKTEITLEQGLKETLDWVDANWASLKTMPWSYIHKS